MDVHKDASYTRINPSQRECYLGLAIGKLFLETPVLLSSAEIAAKESDSDMFL
jgi:hypothetical protein